MRTIKPAISWIGAGCLALGTFARGGAAEDWQAVVALDAGPQQKLNSAREARQVTLDFLQRQEQAYRAFFQHWPADAHALDVQLRLAHLLVVKADFQARPADREEAMRLLNALAANPATPTARRADVQFARLSLAMRTQPTTSREAPGEMLSRVRTFQKAWPADRRLAPLLAEVASLYDAKPEQKKLLLDEALALTQDERLRARIADDLRRIALLGTPIRLRFRSVQGAEVDLATLAGKVVVIVFFATWSAPSIAALDALPSWPAGQVAVIGVSVDRDAAQLRQVLVAGKFTAPVACDGLGWESPRLRGWGINALPTIWILDRQGRLRTLNASAAPDALVQSLLREH